MIIFDKYSCPWIVFSVCVPYSFFFLLFKNEAVNKRHLTRNFDVARFCCLNCLSNIAVYIMLTRTENISLQTLPSFPSFLLMTNYWRGDSQLRHISTRNWWGGGGVLKFEDFRGTSFMIGPLSWKCMLGWQIYQNYLHLKEIIIFERSVNVVMFTCNVDSQNC